MNTQLELLKLGARENEFAISEFPTPTVPKLTKADKAQIVATLSERPDKVIGYYLNPESEACGSRTSCSLGAIKRGGLWEVWSWEEESGSLVYGAAFTDRSVARAKAREWAEQILAAVEDDLADQKSAEEEQRLPSGCGLTGPFVFSDSNDFEEGWELDDEEEVFAFFRRREYLLRPEEWGNCYSCSLLDDNQRSCWVALNLQGEMRLYPE